MAIMPSKIMIKAEPNIAIVDILCDTLNCRFNLANASNTEDARESRCNLKCIVIQDGKCLNFEEMKECLTKSVNSS